MQYRTSRALALILATAGACLTASGVQAQSAGRYMTWANRPATTTPGNVAAAQAQAANGIIPRRVAPAQCPARPTMQAPTPTLVASRGLTPASAWIGPRVAPAFAPGSPDPIAYATTGMDAPVYAPPRVEHVPNQSVPVERVAAYPAPSGTAAPVADLPRPLPAPVQPSPRMQTQAAPPAPLPQPAAQSSATIDPNDPMAPRRDARIFQIQGDTQGRQQASAGGPDPAPASVQAGQSGTRYYSVHRDAGHRPDPTALPEPVYFDSVSMDLAEPPPAETYVRDAQGRRRVVAAQEPSLP